MLTQSVDKRDFPWHDGTWLQWWGQGRTECSVGFPTGLQVSVRAQASLGKILQEIISQISTTVFHNFCYLNLVGSCSLSKTYF